MEFKKEKLQTLLRQKRVVNIFIENKLFFVDDYFNGYIYLTKAGYKDNENDNMKSCLKLSKYMNNVTGYSYTGIV